MKISMVEIERSQEEEIVIRCHQVDENIMNLVRRLKVASSTVTGTCDERIYNVPVNAIYYFETVENKGFFYTKDKVFESKMKLFQFEDTYGGDTFFRASKSVVLNLTKIVYVKPVLSGRFEATLKNKEKVIVSRQYVGDLKRLLGVKEGR